VYVATCYPLSIEQQQEVIDHLYSSDWLIKHVHPRSNTKVIPPVKGKIFLRVCQTEKEMLHWIFFHMENTSYIHNVIAWYADFDKKGTSDRVKANGLNPVWEHLNVIDIMPMYVRAAGMQNFEGRSALHWSARDTLGYGKVVRTEDIPYLVQNDPVLLTVYNVWDSILPMRLNYYYKDLVYQWKGYTDFCGLNITDWSNNSYLVEELVQRWVFPEGRILPSRGQNRYFHSIEGGYVKPPVAGLHMPCIELDITKTYPNVMISGNLSSETLVENPCLICERYDYCKHVDEVKKFLDRRSSSIKFVEKLAREMKSHMGEMYQLINEGKLHIPTDHDFIDPHTPAVCPIGEFEPTCPVSVFPSGRIYRRDISSPVPNMLRELTQKRDEVRAKMKGVEKEKDFLRKTGKLTPEKEEELDDLYDIYFSDQFTKKTIMNCFSDDTKLLTDDGIKLVRDIKVGDKVLTVNRITKKVEEEKVIRTYEYDYDDILYRFTGSRMDWKVTGNHRLIHTSGRFVFAEDVYSGGRFDIIKHQPQDGWIHDISLWDFDDNDYVFIKSDKNMKVWWAKKYGGDRFYKVKKDVIKYHNTFPYPIYFKDFDKSHYTPSIIPVEPFFKFLGWYLSEGSLYHEKGRGKRGETYDICISQQKVENRERIISVIKSMGYTPRIGKKDISFSSRSMFKYLEKFGVSSTKKFIPHDILKADSCLLRSMYDTMMLGDGTVSGGISKYTTKSNKLADSFVNLCYRLGLRCRLYKEKDGINRIIIYKDVDNLVLLKKQMKKEHYQGKVYSIEVEHNKTVIAGRNGNFGPIGNSVYGQFVYKKFRLADSRIGEDITDVARRQVHWNADVIENYHPTMRDIMGLDSDVPLKCQVVYSDTDSNKYVIANLDEINKSLKKDLEEDDFYKIAQHYVDKINSTYPDFSKQVLGQVTDVAFEVKIEEVMEAFYVWSAKKNYIYKKFGTEKPKKTGISRSDKMLIFHELTDDMAKLILKGDIIGLSQYLAEFEQKVLSGEYRTKLGRPKALRTWEEDKDKVKVANSLKGFLYSMLYSNKVFGKKFKMGDKPVFFTHVKSVDGYDPPENGMVALDFGDDPEDFGIKIDYAGVLKDDIIGNRAMTNFLKPFGGWNNIKSGFLPSSESLDDLW